MRKSAGTPVRHGCAAPRVGVRSWGWEERISRGAVLTLTCTVLVLVSEKRVWIHERLGAGLPEVLELGLDHGACTGALPCRSSLGGHQGKKDFSLFSYKVE